MSTIASRMNTRTLGPLLLPHLPLPGGRGGLHGSSRGSGDGPWGRPGDAGPRGCRGVTSALLQACLRLQGVPASGRGGVGERVRGERGARRGQFKPRKTANPPRCHLKGTAKATPAAKPAATKCMILLQRMIMLRERARAGDSGQGKGGGRQRREGWPRIAPRTLGWPPFGRRWAGWLRHRCRPQLPLHPRWVRRPSSSSWPRPLPTETSWLHAWGAGRRWSKTRPQPTVNVTAEEKNHQPRWVGPAGGGLTPRAH
jgi:hypothetical protein